MLKLLGMWRTSSLPLLSGVLRPGAVAPDMYSLNVKTVLLQTIQFSISTQFKYQNSSISKNSV